MIGRLLTPLLEKLPENNRLERIWKIAQVDFKKRYYNDKFGLLWALLNPLSRIAIYYFVFTRIFSRGRENYELYLFCGLAIWLAFSQATNSGMALLRIKRYLIENIQFDWLDLYYSHMISASIGFLFNLGAYCLILVIKGVSFGTYWYMFPFILMSWFFVSMAVTIVLGLLRPMFDDVVHIWGIATIIGFWSSGIFYDGEFFFEHYTWFMYINPFVGLILNTRGCLLEGSPFYMQWCLYNLMYCFTLLLLAIYIFRKNAHRVIEKI